MRSDAPSDIREAAVAGELSSPLDRSMYLA